jgi:hypothetical protein
MKVRNDEITKWCNSPPFNGFLEELNPCTPPQGLDLAFFIFLNALDTYKSVSLHKTMTT